MSEHAPLPKTVEVAVGGNVWSFARLSLNDKGRLLAQRRAAARARLAAQLEADATPETATHTLLANFDAAEDPDITTLYRAADTVEGARAVLVEARTKHLRATGAPDTAAADVAALFDNPDVDEDRLLYAAQQCVRRGAKDLPDPSVAADQATRIKALEVAVAQLKAQLSA